MLTINEMMKYSTFEERLEYLTLEAASSQMTFESLRELNQSFYNSSTWKKIRYGVIARDLGWDLAVPGREIIGKVMVHHMNPLRPKDLLNRSDIAMDPKFLVTVSASTHNAIHYQSPVYVPVFIEREPGDTTLWR